MLRTVQLLPQKGFRHWASTRTVSKTEPPVCYRASWQLPGPDSHRLADTSLRVDYLNATTSKGDITSRTHAAGHTKLRLAGGLSAASTVGGRAAGFLDRWSGRGVRTVRRGAVAGGSGEVLLPGRRDRREGRGGSPHPPVGSRPNRRCSLAEGSPSVPGPPREWGIRWLRRSAEFRLSQPSA